MKLRLKTSHILALLLIIIIGLWMASGEVIIGGTASNANAQQTIAERNRDAEAKAFKVNYRVIEAKSRTETVRVRGRTRANAIIPVRAETGGVLEKRLVNKGDRVKSGDLVCIIDRGARASKLKEAQAMLNQAETEYASNSKLAEKGFASKNRMSQLESQLNAARSAVEQAKLELSRVEIRANASGIVQDPVAEQGDVLGVGAACITLLDTDPMMFIGQVSERDIDRINPGMQAKVSLVNGENVTGEVIYTAPSADPDPRTFGVEIRLEGTKSLRDGMTASALIELPEVPSIRVMPSWLVLNDAGEVGIDIVNDDNIVEFVPVKIITQTRNGFWVSGPKAGQKVITLGQNFVIPGNKVEAIEAAATEGNTTGEQDDAS